MAPSDILTQPQASKLHQKRQAALQPSFRSRKNWLLLPQTTSSTMVINYEGFYAVIVVCLVVLTLVVCCCGFLIIRRNTIARNAAANAERSAEEWQAMGTVPVFAGPIDEEERNELERVRGIKSRKLSFKKSIFHIFIHYPIFQHGR